MADLQSSVYPLPVCFETHVLSPATLLEIPQDLTHGNTKWYLRLCLFKAKPRLQLLSPEDQARLDMANICLLNARVVAGRRQCIAGAMNIVRDLISKKKGKTV